MKRVMRRLVPIAYMAAVVGVTGCGDDDPVQPVALADDVAFTRANGTRVAFPGVVRAWCGEWEPGAIREPSVHVLVGDASGTGARWMLTVVRRDITIGQPLVFPNSFVFDQPRGAELFVLDPPNEASTQINRSSGQLTFETVDCADGGGIRFRINATIGSELANGPSLTAAGSFASPITGPPR